MAENTSIEWTHRAGTTGATWNSIRARNLESGGIGHFCTHHSEGCRFCYAETFQPRFDNRIRYAAQDRAKVEIFVDEKTLLKPLRWRKPRTVFVCSMTDLFGEFHTDEQIDQVFAVMALCPQHTFQVLTKRPERMQRYVVELFGPGGMLGGATGRMEAWLGTRMPDSRDLFDHLPGMLPTPLENVWLGVSVEDQAAADERVPHLLATPAAIRFVSYEPALGPVDFEHIESGNDVVNALEGVGLEMVGYQPYQISCNRLDWIIAGGESGPGARPAHPDWFRAVRDQCAAAGVPFFFKQWGAWLSVSEVEGPGAHFSFPDGATVRRVGKKAAGRTLDGNIYHQFPEVAGI